MDAHLVPPAAELVMLEPAWRNLFENVLTVQFNHRIGAYVLWIAVVLHAIDVQRSLRGYAPPRVAMLLAAAVTLQAVFGILTLLYRVPIGLGLLHQGMAVIVLLLAVVHAERLATRSVARSAALGPIATAS
jgi:cytochrome c oxidase assembly protein subunit 15